MKIFIADPITKAGIDYLKNKGHEIVDTQDADALLVRSKTKVTKEMIDSFPNLKVIGRAGVGLDNIDCIAAKEKEIEVVNAPGSNAESVAEHAIALILALSRNIPNVALSMRAGKWEKSSYRGMELMGKTLGIIGYGHVGKRVGELAAAFGMKLMIYVKEDPLDMILAESDFLTIHATLNEKTRGMIGATELSKMKKTAYLINTARGAVVDENALIAALKNGTIAGAALDVFAMEPTHSELLTLKNVICTPHVASVSPESGNRASVMVAEAVCQPFDRNSSNR